MSKRALILSRGQHKGKASASSPKGAGRSRQWLNKSSSVLRRGEQDPDKRPPSSRLLLRACFHVSSKGSGLRGCQLSQFSEGYIPRCLPLLDGECETGGKT